VHLVVGHGGNNRLEKETCGLHIVRTMIRLLFSLFKVFITTKTKEEMRADFVSQFCTLSSMFIAR
jgi:hypothetical protein